MSVYTSKQFDSPAGPVKKNVQRNRVIHVFFGGIASYDNLFSADDLHLIYSRQRVSSAPVTAMASPAVRSQTVPLHHVLTQSIRQGNAALSARMVSFSEVKKNTVPYL